MAPLAKWLSILGKKEELEAYELARIQAMLTQSALDEIEHLQKHHIASKETLKQITEEYRALKEKAEKEIQDNKPQTELLSTEESLRVQRYLLNLQKSRLLEAYHKGSISRGLFEKLNTEIDARLLNIDNMES